MGHELKQGTIAVLTSKSAGYIYLGLAMILTGLVGYRLENTLTAQTSPMPSVATSTRDTAHAKSQQLRSSLKSSPAEKQIGR